MNETLKKTLDPPAKYYGGGKPGWVLALRTGDTLGKIAPAAGQEIRIVRMADGQFALGMFKHTLVGHVGGEAVREHTVPFEGNGLCVGSLEALVQLGQAIQAVAKSLGPPNEGG